MGYEINPHGLTTDCASVQAFSVVRGDDQIRTGVTAQRIDCRRISPHGSGLALPYSLAMGLVVAASFGWPFVLVFVLVAGPALGFSFARRTVSRPHSTAFRTPEQPLLNTDFGSGEARSS